MARDRFQSNKPSSSPPARTQLGASPVLAPARGRTLAIDVPVSKPSDSAERVADAAAERAVAPSPARGFDFSKLPITPPASAQPSAARWRVA
jgi:hypothetical protein